MKGTAQTDELDTGDSAIKEELKQTALKGGALVFGVADASAFTAAAEGYRPTDIWPPISLGARVTSLADASFETPSVA